MTKNNGPSVYDQRGVSADKREVHDAIEGLDKGLYPDAFCKILPDILGGNDSYCNIMHADTAGTKTALAYLYWRETGDLSVWRSIAQDAMVMNTDDMACVGCTEDIVISSTIGRNKHLITGEVIKALILGNQHFIDKMATLGSRLVSAGGETADVGDVVRTIDVGITAFARLKKDQLIINDIRDGDVIVGLASYGQSSYEDQYNSGIGSNGLTSARHDVLSKYYLEHYPESADPNTSPQVQYVGTKRLTDRYRGYEVGQLLLSPTRSFLPIIRALLDKHRSDIHGMIHNTGGAHTKVLNFVHNKKIIKDHLLPLPPVFELIQAESNASWREMYQVFNMGVRLEIYTDEASAKSMLDIIAAFNIEARIIGRVESADKKTVYLQSDYGTFLYQ